MFQISNVEFMLLALIHEHQKISGYQLNRVVQERGYREWADIGTTSIYLGVKKLKQKGYVASATDRYKRGKGPKGINYALTPDGLSVLTSEVEHGLAETRERDRRFDLALSALHILAPTEIFGAISRRKEQLSHVFELVRSQHDLQKADMSLGGELIFRHSFTTLTGEIAFLDEMLARIRQETPA